MRAKNQRKYQKTSSVRKAAVAEKKRPRLNPKRFALTLAALCFGIYFIYMMIWQQINLSSKNQEIEALEEKISAAEQQSERLQEEVDHLNDPEYIERIAREKLGLVRPNERVFVDSNRSDTNSGN